MIIISPPYNLREGRYGHTTQQLHRIQGQMGYMYNLRIDGRLWYSFLCDYNSISITSVIWVWARVWDLCLDFWSYL